MHRQPISILAILMSSAVAFAQDAPQTTTCSDLTEDAARLACYDAIAGHVSLGPQAETPNVEPSTVTTKEIVAPILPTEYKVADPQDLAVAPNKFKGKPIEIRGAHCYYADVNDYRCLAPGANSVAIFTSSINPPEAKDRLESDCGAMKVATSNKCLRTLHFVSNTVSEDFVDAMTRRTVFKPDQITFVAPRAKGH